jgi:hypothetical protein
LAARILLVPYLGTGDMTVYAAWGQHTRDAGLANAYMGVYFPLAYQLFAGDVAAASWLGVSTFSVMKAVNLLFDIGTFGLLLALLRQYRLDARYAFYYWLHPYFLAIFWLGYVDPFLTFCAVLTLVLLGRLRSVTGALVAGVPLAAAVMFKPQALTLVVMTGLLIVGLLIFRRRVTNAVVRASALLVPSGLAFVGYSLYFRANGFPLSFLARFSYDTLKTFSPGLTENMLNVWTPVAYHYVEHGQRLYTVTGPGVYHTIGDLLVVLAFVLAVLVVCIAASRRQLAWLVLSVFTLGALLLPVLGTRAHENHLFLGITFAVVALAAMPNRPFAAAFNLLLAVQFVNLGARYGFGQNHLTRWKVISDLISWYGNSAQLAAASVTIISFTLVLFFVGRALVGGRRRTVTTTGASQTAHAVGPFPIT